MTENEILHHIKRLQYKKNYQKTIEFINNLSNDDKTYFIMLELANVYTDYARELDYNGCKKNIGIAFGIFENLQNNHDDDKVLYFKWAQALKVDNKIRLSVEKLEKSLAIDSEYEEAKKLHERYTTYFIPYEIIEHIDELGDNDEYQEIINYIELLDEKNKSYNVLSELGRAYNNLANNVDYDKESEEIIDKAINIFEDLEKHELSKNDEALYYRWGYAYFVIDDTSNAIKMLEKSLKIDSKSENSLDLIKTIINGNDVEIKSKKEIYKSFIINIIYENLSDVNKKIFDKYLSLLPSWSRIDYHDFRGYRTKSEYGKLKDIVVFLYDLYDDQIESFDFMTYLKGEFEYDYYPNCDYIASLISTDEGSQVYDYIKNMIYNSENLVALNNGIIGGLIKSDREDSNTLVMDLLKAAKLSEGLRQSVVERIDIGTIETYKYFLEYIRAEKLARFSSVKRAFLCYTGFEYYITEAKTIDQMGEYVFECLLDDKVEEYLQSDNALKIYIALYAKSCHEYNDAFNYVIENITKVADYKKNAFMTFLSKSRKSLSIEMINSILENSNDNQVFMHLSSVNIAESENVSNEQKRKFINLVTDIMSPLKVKDFKKTSLDGKGTSSIYSHSYYKLAFEFAHKIDDLYEKVYPLFEKYFYYYSYNDEYNYIEEKINNPIVKNTIISNLSKNQRDFAFGMLKKIQNILTKEDYLKIANEFKSKRSEVRQNINTLLASASDDIILACAKMLLEDKIVEKRMGAISILKEVYDRIKNSDGFIELKEILENAKLPTEVAQVRDSILHAGIDKKQEWFFNTEYKIEIPQNIKIGKDRGKHCSSILSALFEKIIGKKLSKISIKDFEAIIQKFVDIFESHIGEDVKIYNYDGEKTAKTGYEYGLVFYFSSDAYNKYDTYPYYNEYIEITKSLTDEEFVCLWIFSEFIEKITDKNYLDENSSFVFLSDTYKEYFSFDLLDIKNIKDSKKVIHFNRYMEMLLKYREQEFKNKIWHDEKVHNFILDFLTIYILNARLLCSETEGKKYFDNIISRAKKMGSKRLLWKTNDEVELRDVLSFYYISYLTNKIFAEDIKIKDEKKSEDIFLNMLEMKSKDENNNYPIWLFIGILERIENGKIKEDYIHNEILIKYNEELLRAITNSIGKTKFYGSSNEKLSGKLKDLAARIYNTAANKIIEIELERTESETPYSPMISYCIVDNSEVFLKTIYKMGKMPFVRGYSYTSGNPIKDVFSTIVTNTLPQKDFSAKKYKTLVDKYKIGEQKLLEASMYNLKFMPYTEKYLGMHGLTKCSYYFRAHMNEGFDDDVTKIVRRYSDIDKTDFTNGQMDLDWFRESYAELGEENFYKLYDAAKYITDGGKHKRAQYFADAVLGKLDIQEVETRISDKRNQEMILAYGLIPFAKDKLKDALARYKKLQEFLKESKQFGAQRRASEALKVSIAMNNLARNYGFKDAQRFSWNMETELYKGMANYFTAKKVEDIKVYISLENIEKPRIVVVKEGKELKSLPSKYNKNVYVLELKEAQKDLRAQFKRARASLENTMVYEDELSIDELIGLQKHPIISSILKNILFVSDENIGLLNGSELINYNNKSKKLKSNSMLKIAHPIVLLENNCWAQWQEYLMKESIIQPFKQIFREIYTLTKDETKEKGITYRFGGYQIDKTRAFGILKTRGWLVSEYQGFEKVNHKENIRIELYSYADWFTPSEIESPSIEKVEFIDNKTNEKIDITKMSKVLYSETMRDLDLVVSVAYVGGVDPMLNHSTIEMRKRILTHNLELFNIKNYKFENNHIMIEGKLNSYSLHLGSAIIHTKNKGMLPIFPVHSQHRGHIFLPFIDSDPKTSEIISKALMLAEDDKIKDPSVLMHLK